MHPNGDARFVLIFWGAVITLLVLSVFRRRK